MRRQEKKRRPLFWVRRKLNMWEARGGGKTFRVVRVGPRFWELHSGDPMRKELPRFPNRLVAMRTAEAQLDPLEILGAVGRE